MSNSKEFTFNWRIEHFSMLLHPRGNSLTSGCFSTSIFAGTNFYIELYPRGHTEECENYLSCYIQRKETKVGSIQLGFSLTLKSYHDSADKSLTVDSYELITEYGWKQFVPLKLINENRSIYLPQDVLTIQCKIWDPKGKEGPDRKRQRRMIDNLQTEPPFNECTSLTRIQVSKQSAVWPIANVSTSLESKEKVFFHVKSFIEGHPSFKLSLSFGDDSDFDSVLDYAQIEITQTESFPKKTIIFVKSKIAVLSAPKDYQYSQVDTFSYDSSVDCIWRFPQFIRLSHLKDEKYLHLGNTLYLSCDFSFITDASSSYDIEVPKYNRNAFVIPSLKKVGNLSNKIAKLFDDNQFCDVTLKVDDQTFGAHKVVLCAQSPVFCAMFEKDMKEKNTNVIEIEDVKVNIVKLMLDFLHSDILDEKELSNGDACSLYAAADKYQISYLKHKCTSFLLCALEVDNVCDDLVTADQHQDDFLMHCVIEFVKRNATEVFDCYLWEEFMIEYPVLSGKVMLQVLKSI